MDYSRFTTALDFAPRSDSPSLETSLHPPRKLLDLISPRRSQIILQIRRVRNNIWFSTSIPNNTMNPLRRLNLLSQQRNIHIRRNNRIKGILPMPGRISRMSTLPRKRHLHLPPRTRPRRRNTIYILLPLRRQLSRRMSHQTSIYTLVSTSFDKVDLSTAAFFSWCAEEANAAGDVEGAYCLGGGDECGDGACCDEVVAAGVAETGKGVVFCVEDDEFAVLAGFDFERGLDAVGGPLDVVAETVHKIADVVVGFELFVVELWVFMDLKTLDNIP